MEEEVESPCCTCRPMVLRASDLLRKQAGQQADIYGQFLPRQGEKGHRSDEHCFPYRHERSSLLKIVDEATVWEGDVRPAFHMTRCYVPRRLDGVSGSGDALTLKALARRRPHSSHAR